MGTFIFLRETTPLDFGFAFGMFLGEIANFSRQLAKGVAFLHRHGISHIDIKLQNIVALRNFEINCS
jgi:tRNA A-37 threonylcarbamoyl transferase component Bud32